MLEVRLLGKFEVKHQQKLISIASRPAQSLACLAGFAAIAARRGNAISAVRLFGAVDFLLHTFSASLLPIDEKAYQRNISLLRSNLDKTTFDVMWVEGSEMTSEEAIEFAHTSSKPPDGQ